MGFLKDVYERRKKYFENLDGYFNEIKEFLRDKVRNFEFDFK